MAPCVPKTAEVARRGAGHNGRGARAPRYPSALHGGGSCNSSRGSAGFSDYDQRPGTFKLSPVQPVGELSASDVDIISKDTNSISNPLAPVSRESARFPVAGQTQPLAPKFALSRSAPFRQSNRWAWFCCSIESCFRWLSAWHCRFTRCAFGGGNAAVHRRQSQKVTKWGSGNDLGDIRPRSQHV